MNKQIFFALEIKRVIRLAGRMLAGAIVLAVLAGTIAFSAGKILYRSNDLLSRRIEVGIVMPPSGDKQTELVVEFLESMDSVKASCDFLYMEEEEAMDALDAGDLAAVMILPEAMLQSIINGENRPVQVIFPEEGNLSGALLEELTRAGARVLGGAQAGIYAAYDLLICVDRGDAVQATFDALNDRYLTFGLARTRAFETVTVQATGRLSAISYYIATGIICLLMLIGLGMGDALSRPSEAIREKLSALGMGSGMMVLGRFVSLFCFLLPLTMAFGLLGSLAASLTDEDFSLGTLISQTAGGPVGWIAGMLLTSAVIAAALGALMLAIYSWMPSGSGGILALFGVTAAGMMLPGGLIPEVFWPEQAHFLKYLPVGRICELFRSAFLLPEERTAVWPACAGWTLAYTGILLLLAWCGLAVSGAVRRNIGNGFFTGRTAADLSPAGADSALSGGVTHGGSFGGAHSGSFGCVPAGTWCLLTLKRMAKRPWVWLMVVLFTCLLVFIHFQDRDRTALVHAGVYAEGDSLDCARLMTEAGSHIDFELYDSEEALIEGVMTGRLECGYVLPGDLWQRMRAGENRRLMTVYTAPGTVAAPLINEIVFSYVFDHEAAVTLAECLKEQLQDDAEALALLNADDETLEARSLEAWMVYTEGGGTFTFAYEGDTDGTGVPTGIYDMIGRSLFGLMVVLCALMGGSMALGRGESAGIYTRMSRTRSRLLKLLTIALWTGAGTLAAAAGMRLCGEKGIIMLIFYWAAVSIYIWILSLASGNSARFFMVIPVVVLGCCLACFVQIGLSDQVPLLDIAAKLFPAGWIADPLVR